MQHVGIAPAHPRSVLRLTAQAVLLALVYFSVSKAALLLAIPPGYATPVWPGAGIALGASLIWGRKILIGLFLGSLLVNLSVAPNWLWQDPVQCLSMCLLIASGAYLQCFIAHSILRHLLPADCAYDTNRSVFVLIGLGGALCSIIGASVAVSGLWLFGRIDSSEILFSWWTWWTGDTVGVLIFVPVTLIAAGHPRIIWRSRLFSVGAPLLLSFAAACMVLKAANQSEESRLRGEFERMAKTVSADIRSATSQAGTGILRGAAFVENSDQFSYGDFLDHIHPILHEHPELSALSWVPRVPRTDLNGFLKQVRSLDFPQFAIRQLENLGSTHSDLFPVTYIAPLQVNSTAQGFDLGSESARRDMLERAAINGRLTASMPIQLVQESSEQAILFTIPVYQNNAILEYGRNLGLNSVRGFVTGTLRTQDLLSKASSLELIGAMSLEVSTVNSNGDRKVLISFPKMAAANDMMWQEEIEIAGTIWEIYARPSVQFIAKQRSVLSWMVLLSALGLSGLLGAFLLLVTGQMHRVENAVAQRTEDLNKEVKSRRVAETRLRHSEAQFRKLAYHDSLTGLANREYFSRRLTEAVELAQRDGQMLAVHFFDLDHFKDINDSMGHPVGDGLLQSIASALNRSLRRTDVLARLGGDEFAILQTGILDESQAETLAHTTLTSLIQPFHVSGYEVRTSSSVGISLYDGRKESDKRHPDEISVRLMEQADIALYEVKDSRRGEYLFHTPAMTARVHNSIAVGNALKKALDNNLPELYLAYQPQIDMRTGNIDSYEVLIRWNSEELGDLGPAEFIPIAEARGLIIELGHFTLRNACQFLAKTRSMQPDGRPFKLAVNVSSTQFADPGFVRDVKNILEEEGVAAQNIELELTEAVLSRNISQVADTLYELRRMGFEIAIDDFGTGYSSLLYLKKLPVGRIKVAQEFVRDMIDDPADAEIVRATIQIARAMELDIIAEGVESIEHVDNLLALGCRHAQGYYYSKPIAEQDLYPTWGLRSPRAA